MNKDYDLIYCILNFSMPTKSGHKFMNRQSFYDNVINSEKFHQAMESDQVMGLLTHKGRYYDQLDPKIPYADNVILNEWWANILKGIEVKGDEVLAYLKLVDHKKGGQAVKNILKDGTPLGVSMSTFCDNNVLNEYYITALLGVDHTMDPAFLGTRLVAKNFSQGMFNDLQSNVSTSIYTKDQNFNIVNFSYDNAVVLENRLNIGNSYNIPLDLSQNIEEYFSAVNTFDKYFFNKEQLKVLTPDNTIIMEEAAKSSVNFSLLKQMMIEAGYPPHRRLQRRIEELIREVKGKNTEHVERYRDVYFSFINTPIYDWISKAFNSDSKIMLAIGLRLGRYMRNPSVVQAADRKLEVIKRRRASVGGVFDKQAQKQLDGVLKELFEELWKYIEEKANVEFVSEGSVKTMLKTFDNNNNNYKTVEDWLDAGSDGQKNYNIWVDNFPYSAKDLDEFKKSRKYYGDDSVDKLINLLANKTISKKDKEKLVELMDNANIKNFSNKLTFNRNIYPRQFDDGSTIDDQTPLSNQEIEENSLLNRTLTSADIDAIVTKLLKSPEGLEMIANKMIEMGYANPPDGSIDDPNAGDPNQQPQEGEQPTDPNAQGDPNAMGSVPVENPPLENQQVDPNQAPAPEPTQQGGNPPVEGQPAQNPQVVADNQPMIPAENNQAAANPQGDVNQAQPPQNQVPSQVVNDSQYAKPKSITKEQAQSLMSFSSVNEAFELMITENFSNIDKKKLISFSVIELLNPLEMSSEAIDMVHFAFGSPNGVNKDIITDLMAAKYQFFSGVIGEDDYNLIKTNLLCNLIG